jgi:hypothetical protein
MYKKLIFVDLENVQRLDDSVIVPHTKLFIMVGYGQEKQGLELLKEKFDKCDAIELIKVNGQGHNALDFFIAFYLGKYYNELKNITVVICTKDGGFDPLKEHLANTGIDIIRLGLKTANAETSQKAQKEPVKKQAKPAAAKKIKAPISNDISAKVKEVCGQLAANNKARPRKLKTLKQYITVNLKVKYSDKEAEEIIAAMQKEGKLTITDRGKGTIKLNV